MARSIFKLPYVHRSLFSACLINRQNTYNTIQNVQVTSQKSKEKVKNVPRFLYFWKKASCFNWNIVDRKISIYNGKVFLTWTVSAKHIGYKIGAFSITRRTPPHAGKQKQIKKVSRSLERLVEERRRIVNRGKSTKRKRI